MFLKIYSCLFVGRDESSVFERLPKNLHSSATTLLILSSYCYFQYFKNYWSFANNMFNKETRQMGSKYFWQILLLSVSIRTLYGPRPLHVLWVWPPLKKKLPTLVYTSSISKQNRHHQWQQVLRRWHSQRRGKPLVYHMRGHLSLYLSNGYCSRRTKRGSENSCITTPKYSGNLKLKKQMQQGKKKGAESIKKTGLKWLIFSYSKHLVKICRT
jgi:hypothetical protein